jgi:hypothetical protein
MVSNRFIRTAAVFFVIGVFLGIYMGITKDFRFTHVHAHVNLLGWVALGLCGLIYGVRPQLQQGWWPQVHYWFHTLGLVSFMGGFAWGTVTGVFAFMPVAVGASMVAVGVVVFALNVCLRLGAGVVHEAR